MIEILKYIKEKSPADFVIAIVVDHSGSVPQPKGAAMLVASNGEIVGTIGGGLLEHECIAQCKSMLGVNTAGWFDFNMNHSYDREAGPICGGNVRILMTSRAQEIRLELERYASFLKTETPCRLDFSIDEVSELFGRGVVVPKSDEESENTCAIDLTSQRKLLVSGSGHCGLAIAELGAWLGFETFLIDPRVEMKKGNFERCASSLGEFIAAHPIDHYTAVILVNKGHKDDALALEQCLHSTARYLGMIGSKRKITLMKKDFLDNGLATPAEWSKIHAPIGVDINAIEVKDIALSVMTEVVAVFNGIDPSQHLSSMKLQ